MRTLVTGGAGFIGSHLVDRLLAEGHDVQVLDDLSGGTPDNLPASHPCLRLHVGSVTDREAVETAMVGQDVVFHLASNASVPASIQDPVRDHLVNVKGTELLLDAARRHGAGDFVFAGSAAVYGVLPAVPVNEGHPPRPNSPYGRSKLAAEQAVRRVARENGLATTVFRIFNAYGPRQRRYVMHDLFQKMRGSPGDVEILGTGNEVRDFVYIRDVVDCLFAAARDPNLRDRTFNLGTGVGTPIHAMARRLADYLGLDGGYRPRMTGTSWEGDVPWLQADVSALAAAGLRAQTRLDEGLRATVGWFSDNLGKPMSANSTTGR